MHAPSLPPRPEEGGVEGGVGGRPGDGPGVGRVLPDCLHGEVPAAVLRGPRHLNLHYVPLQEAEDKLISGFC